jgi:hypothetical protein
MFAIERRQSVQVGLYGKHCEAPFSRLNHCWFDFTLAACHRLGFLVVSATIYL